MGPVSELIDPNTGPSSGDLFGIISCLHDRKQLPEPIKPPPETTSLEQFTVLGEPGINAGIAIVQRAQ